ncbi:hypothetical protein [Sediminitomix flava]|uniref:Secreted protein (Por secretion system target) n=1 Tax=Sediminitomix flava TaxID=379075 RepID=A0A315ZEJ5_SEDFL|nr:hypothetical protein [Sediminitomix flava]PWJ43144.1 hypothetical protein BC781_102693 [Sediminitomix flava]
MNKQLSIALSLIMAMLSLVSCDDSNEAVNTQGVLTLNVESLSLENAYEIHTTIGGTDYVIEENENIFLSAGFYEMTKFEIYENGALSYFLVGQVGFEIKSGEITVVEVPVIPVQDGDSGIGVPEFEVEVDPYHAIRNGMTSVVIEANSSTGVTPIRELIDDGFPTLRFSNNEGSPVLFTYYKYGNASETNTVIVGDLQQHFIVVPSTGTYIVEYLGKKKTLTVQ